jgi:hypothetical protein
MEEEMSAQQQFPQQRKGSLLWLWISLAVVGGLVLIVVGYYVLVVGAFLYADRPTPTVGTR